MKAMKAFAVVLHSAKVTILNMVYNSDAVKPLTVLTLEKIPSNKLLFHIIQKKRKKRMKVDA